MKAMITVLLLLGANAHANPAPTIKCVSASGSAFSGTLVRGAHYDSICEIKFWVGHSDFAQYIKGCVGSLYSSAPHFVGSLDLGVDGSIEIKANEKGEQIYVDRSGTHEAGCGIENDFSMPTLTEEQLKTLEGDRRSEIPHPGPEITITNRLVSYGFMAEQAKALAAEILDFKNNKLSVEEIVKNFKE